MFKSIIDDIRNSFETGSMMIRIVIINVAIYMILALMEAFVPSFASTLNHWLAIPGDPSVLLTRPWTIFSHMFVHAGFWHMAWNMILFYWFANIVGDLLGDKRVLPVYIFGGLAGALAYLLFFQISDTAGYMAMGASAAVLALVFTAVTVAPDYNMNLLIIGNVKIKYVGLFILFFDLIGVKSGSNSGGHAAHLGGAAFGALFVYLLRQGKDLSDYFYAVLNVFKSSSSKVSKRPGHLRVEHKADNTQRRPEMKQQKSRSGLQQKVDQILEKIKNSGYDSLTDEEKEILFQASKEN
ncbi:MAG: rhomboid family intramembrane serine protease [Saprospiraceae bacterium]|nr:rhomboid family intramembrane serine protease [Saprospiraceae bacterium]